MMPVENGFGMNDVANLFIQQQRIQQQQIMFQQQQISQQQLYLQQQQQMLMNLQKANQAKSTTTTKTSATKTGTSKTADVSDSTKSSKTIINETIVSNKENDPRVKRVFVRRGKNGEVEHVNEKNEVVEPKVTATVDSAAQTEEQKRKLAELEAAKAKAEKEAQEA